MRALSASRATDLLAALYQRAPITVLTLSSLLVSFLGNAAYLDYCLFQAAGAGGYGPPTLLKWLHHAFILRPLSMSNAAAKDPTYLPLDDREWEQRISRSGKTSRLAGLPRRDGSRPAVFGCVPHRQLESTERAGSEVQTAIISHLEQVVTRKPSSLLLAVSSYEGDTAPALYVSQSTPTRDAKLFLSSTPPPKNTLQGFTFKDTSKHELAHLHLHDGSMHIVLSPQDARRVIGQGWGELHPLAGVFYRGFHLPPYWLPSWVFGLLGGQSQARWGYLQQRKDDEGRSVPPTYCMLYAANTSEQLEWVKAILDASVAWASGVVE